MYEFADLVLDIPDFSIPTPAELDNTCAKIIDAMFDGKMVYVGCMAGRGRTGLVLSCLAKAFGIAGPVEYVRKHYYKGAVETASQYAFVTGVPMPKTAKRLRINRFKYLFKKIGA
jgi:protein-tyrosine phosphatase